METFAKLMTTVLGAKDASFRLLVLLMFLAWGATEGLSYWAPDFALGNSHTKALSADIEAIKAREVARDEKLDMLQNDYITATNTMTLMNQKFTAELTYMRERQDDAHRVIHQELERHQREIDRR